MSCEKAKAPFTCGICKESLCKQCVQFVEDGSFSFLREIPEKLTHTTYCSACYESEIAPAIHDYEEIMNRAKEVSVFLKNQGKESRLMKRIELPLTVTGCPDREEALLRLAFQAAQADFNFLVDVDLTSEKIRNGGYQTSTWRAVGIPAKKVYL